MGASESQHSHLCGSFVFIQRRMEGMGVVISVGVILIEVVGLRVQGP